MPGPQQTLTIFRFPSYQNHLCNIQPNWLIWSSTNPYANIPKPDFLSWIFPALMRAFLLIGCTSTAIIFLLAILVAKFSMVWHPAASTCMVTDLGDMAFSITKRMFINLRVSQVSSVVITTKRWRMKMCLPSTVRTLSRMSLFSEVYNQQQNIVETSAICWLKTAIHLL